MPTSRPWNISPTPSYRTLSSRTVMSIIHFKLIYTYGVREGRGFSPHWYQKEQHGFLKSPSLPHWPSTVFFILVILSFFLKNIARKKTLESVVFIKFLHIPYFIFYIFVWNLPQRSGLQISVSIFFSILTLTTLFKSSSWTHIHLFFSLSFVSLMVKILS